MDTDIRAELGAFLTNIRSLKGIFKKETSKQINKKDLREKIGQCAQYWFDAIRGGVDDFCSAEILKKYDEDFESLLKFSMSAGNLRTSYLNHLGSISASFNDDITLQVMTTTSYHDVNHAVLDSLLGDISDPGEGEYLREAIECAKKGYLRASIILGWCAGIDRIHRKIEEIGFTQFNVTAAKMASVTTGRFKKFPGISTVTSISELREIFDNNILWVLEGMSLIDMNQHTRLRSCFDMRNHSAHPGDAPITAYNLMSFFSDLKEILLKNKKFKIAPINLEERT